jgi:hypothetical protein
LLRLLRIPDDDLDYLLGDTITETLPLIAAGTFDGDSAALMAAIADRAIDPFARASLLRAFAFLTWDGKIGEEEARRFFACLDDENLAGGDESGVIWDAWQLGIGLLGWRDFTKRVKACFRDRRIPEDIAVFDHFLTDLMQADADPRGYARWKRFNLGYIDDLAESLNWAAAADDEFRDDEVESEEAIQPIINPLRQIGRNDPCPCGSGRKFKKCCIDKA